MVTRLSRGKRDCGHGHRQLGAAQPKLDLGILGALSDKKIILGVIDLSDAKVETAETVTARIRHGLKHVVADRLIPAPDCGQRPARQLAPKARSESASTRTAARVLPPPALALTRHACEVLSIHQGAAVHIDGVTSVMDRFLRRGAGRHDTREVRERDEVSTALVFRERPNLASRKPPTCSVELG